LALPDPVPGLVIRYSYLWAEEYGRGQEEGTKDRPGAVILVTTDVAGVRSVTVLPITHAPPSNSSLAVEIPAATKRRLGLDDERSWVLLTEANRFIWPGPDLRPISPGDMASIAYGPLPFALFEQIRQRFIAVIRARRARLVPRTE
jgi:hypothetical protein